MVAGQRTVVVDPDGTAPDWTYVVIARPTGVIYAHQYGGTATRQGEIEGYLVPVDGTAARPTFDEVFLGKLKGTGSWGKSVEEPLVAMIRQAVATIRFWPDTQGPATVELLRLDEGRLAELDEAWIPVLTSDGPGVLMWPNSD